MNFNLSTNPSKKKTKKKKLSMGLNVLGGDDDDDEEEEAAPSASSRAAVNQALLVEQAALRKRAQEAVYDYDGEYDNFKKTQEATKKPEEEEQQRKSRYIGDLLQAAEKRKRERDIVYERKVAREQAAEEAESLDFRGKDKFVTAAYREKLKERELWQAKEERQRQEEEANDVTKKTGGTAMASFYGNLNRNVAMGGDDDRKAKATHNDEDRARGDIANDQRAAVKQSFTEGFEKGTSSTSDENNHKANDKLDVETPEDPATKRRRIRELRKKKVLEARERYFKRHGITSNTQ